MAFSDEEKLGIVRAAIVEKLNDFREWEALKTFLQNVTKDQIKTFIINKLAEAQTVKVDQVAVLQTEESNFAALEDEINSDI